MGINCSSLLRLALRCCQLRLLLYTKVYLTNSGNSWYPGVRLWAHVRVFLTEKQVNLLILRVVLASHPGRRDKCGLWEERRTCLAKHFLVYRGVLKWNKKHFNKAWQVKWKQMDIMTTLEGGITNVKAEPRTKSCGTTTSMIKLITFGNIYSCQALHWNFFFFSIRSPVSHET